MTVLASAERTLAYFQRMRIFLLRKEIFFSFFSITVRNINLLKLCILKKIRG